MEDSNIENQDLVISEFYDHQINIASFTIFEENGFYKNFITIIKLKIK
jgi:hypothetical protein